MVTSATLTKIDLSWYDCFRLCLKMMTAAIVAGLVLWLPLAMLYWFLRGAGAL